MTKLFDDGGITYRYSKGFSLPPEPPPAPDVPGYTSVYGDDVELFRVPPLWVLWAMFWTCVSLLYIADALL